MTEDSIGFLNPFFLFLEFPLSSIVISVGDG